LQTSSNAPRCGRGAAYERTLRVTGASIIFTGITLAIGVAIILLPALAAWLIHPQGLGAAR
jgi:predicted RND superfamily exporter protein